MTITLRGTLIGRIWMPSIACTKPFNVQFSPTSRPFARQWTGLRDALLSITNDGDFQECEIGELTIVVERPIPSGTSRTWHSVRPCRAISDLYNPARFEEYLLSADGE